MAATPRGGTGAGEQLDVRVLGGVQVRVDGEAVDALRSPRARSLLAFLVLHGDVAHSRQRLAFDFWPDSTESQARTNLRNLLHTLRQSHPLIDASLEVTSTTLRWRPVHPTTVDADRFVAAAHAALTAEPDDAEEVIARCRAAVDLYRGDLLPGDDDEWLLARRDALRGQHRDVLRLLTTALIDGGRATEATAVARDLVRADPLDESAHRLRIEAHYAAGDRAGAVRAYHECAATLERELGVEPGEATARVYASLFEDAHVRPSEGTARGTSPLVGRDDEWQLLVDLWRDSVAGRVGVVLVTGEPGIGKTRLVEELRDWCARAGAPVGEARSYASEGDLGFGIVAAWLRSPDIAAGMEQLSHDRRSDLGRLLPELEAPATIDDAGEAERRRRIFDAAVATIAASGRPTLLIADDAQWSDHVSQEFIHYLVRQRNDTGLLVVLTVRREELELAHPLHTLADSLAVLDRLTEVRLERLSRDDTAELASRLAGSRLDDAGADQLFAETEGNPLFVVETLRAGGEHGVTSIASSPRLRAVIDARFRRLSDTAATVLGAAAVVARPCAARVLARVCGLDDASVARGLDELWRRGILVETGTDAYSMSHGKLGEAAYEGLSPPVRRAHHAAAAEYFAERAAHDPDVSSSHVAVHYEAANDAENAITWLQKAAIDAQQVAAYREAVRLLDRAMALVPALPADIRHVRELELLASMPPALGGAEGYGVSRMHDAHRRATDVASRLGVELEPALVRSMVMSALCRNEFDRGAAVAGGLLAHAEARGDASLRIESHYLLGISAFWAGRLDEARTHFELVVAEFDPSTSRRHETVYGHNPQVVCLSRLANTLWFLGSEDAARRTCTDALALADGVGHALSRDTAMIFSCLLAIDARDLDQLRVRSRALGERGLDTLPFVTKHNAIAGLVDVLDGRRAEGIARVRAALARCEGRNFYPALQATIARILVAAHASAGDAVGGLEASESSLAQGGTRLWAPEIHRMRATFLHATGATEAEVEAALHAAETAARRLGAHGHLARIEETRAGLTSAGRATIA